ncbi:hypothetical protein CSKR_107920 [Clonorchis sinensis]|uniref:Uncharacterized protein n=1 Tax=Clonorchis sinensis TaxID=79923 RepID=A0A419PMZ7_CLOSI|nr:hypothetical protein CSKR_107920 [Clonorchis sinensis]
MKVCALSLKIFLPCPRRVFAGSTVKNLLAKPCSNRAEINKSDVSPFRCLPAMPTEGGTMAEIVSVCPSLDRSNRDAEVGYEPRAFRWETRHHKSDPLSVRDCRCSVKNVRTVLKSLGLHKALGCCGLRPSSCTTHTCSDCSIADSLTLTYSIYDSRVAVIEELKASQRPCLTTIPQDRPCCTLTLISLEIHGYAAFLPQMSQIHKRDPNLADSYIDFIFHTTFITNTTSKIGDLLTERSVVRTLPLSFDFPCLGLDNQAARHRKDVTSGRLYFLLPACEIPPQTLPDEPSSSSTA